MSERQQQPVWLKQNGQDRSEVREAAKGQSVQGQDLEFHYKYTGQLLEG